MELFIFNKMNKENCQSLEKTKPLCGVEYARRKTGAVQYAKHRPEGQMQCAVFLPKMPWLFELGQRNMLVLITSCSLKEINVF